NDVAVVPHESADAVPHHEIVAAVERGEWPPSDRAMDAEVTVLDGVVAIVVDGDADERAVDARDHQELALSGGEREIGIGQSLPERDIGGDHVATHVEYGHELGAIEDRA